MTYEHFRGQIDFIRGNSLDILLQRNGNYAKGSDDALHNFKVGADIDGSTPAQAAWGYMTKHLVALRDKIKRNDFADIADLLEKCTDIINYTAIIFAIGVEENAKYCKTNATCACDAGQAPEWATGGLVDPASTFNTIARDTMSAPRFVTKDNE